MTVCYFGIYNSEYSRNKILISGLRKNGVVVIECRTNKKGISKYFDLVKKHWKIRKDYEVMIVGYPGFQAMILARFLTRKPIIFDAFLSIHDSMVFDRKTIVAGSLRARYFWWLDKVSMSLADVVLLDTNEHIKYMVSEFKIPKEKFRRIFIGASIEVFYPIPDSKSSDKFKVLFFGTYIPLQGIEYIVKAAKILENERDVIFEIIGNGQEKKNIETLSRALNIGNIIFWDNVPQAELRKKSSDADVCLGIFGNTEKTKRVIPNKVYECVAMGKPVITADTAAEREFFRDDEIIFVKTADESSIAQAILKVKSQPEFARKIAEKGYNRFMGGATPKILGLKLKKIIGDLYEEKAK